MSDFIPFANRDASPVIKGYIYQVELTILHWLELKSNQEIELERGEDIDIITKIFTKLNESQRTLGQIKFSSKSLTLRSPESIESIANFIAHRIANPRKILFFRYISNASHGKEQGVKIDNCNSAIMAWEQIRRNELEVQDRNKALKTIKEILINAKKPSRVSNKAWKEFTNFIPKASTGDILELIHSFEWSLMEENPVNLENNICNLLNKYTDRAKEKYQRLFCYVFKRLSEKGLKKLTKAELLEQLRLPELNQKDQKLLEKITFVLDNLKTRLNSVEQTVESHENRLNIVEQTVEAYKNEFSTIQSNENKINLGLPIFQSLFATNEIAISTKDVNPQFAIEKIKNIQASNLASIQKLLVLDIPAIKQQLSKNSRESDISLLYEIVNPDITIPPLEPHLSKREKILKKLQDTVDKHTWTAIYGSISSGKTQLAALFVHMSENCKSWIRLRGLSIEQASFRLDIALSLFLEEPISNRSELYDKTCEKLGPNTVIILDDVPRIGKEDALWERIKLLVNACNKNKIKLLTTSSHTFQSIFEEFEQHSIAAEFENNPFVEDEVIEILEAYGAFQELMNPGNINFILGISRGHPALIVAIARYLKSKKWQFTVNEFDSILQGQHTLQINDDVIRRLIETVNDSDSRQLLYRLDLVSGHFSNEEVFTVSTVEPSIIHPLEHLNSLIGLWIQKDSSYRLQISPLLYRLGRNNLDPETAKLCSLALGKKIIEKKTINQLDSLHAITYFITGGNYNQAGIILFKTLQALNEIHNLVDDIGILGIWRDIDLPKEMDLYIRIYIRTAQVVANDKYGKEISYLVDDLVKLIYEASKNDSLAVISAVAITSPILLKMKSKHINNLASIAMTHIPNIPKNIYEQISSQGIEMALFPLMNVLGLNTPQNLIDWIDNVEKIGIEKIKKFFSTKFMENACFIAADSLWAKEAQKPLSDQKWKEILKALEYLTNKSIKLELDMLWACSIRTRMVVLAEHLDKTGEAIKLGKDALNKASKNSKVMFIIKCSMGRAYFYQKELDESVRFYEEALSLRVESYPLEKHDILLRASKAAGSVNIDKAIGYVQKAIEISEKYDEIPDKWSINDYGELGIAYWLSGDLVQSFNAFDEGAKRLIYNKNDTDNWKGLFCLYGHALAYLSHVSSTGKEPPDLANYGVYAPPVLGTFSGNDSRAAHLYNETNYCLLPVTLTQFAEGVGRDEKAIEWASKGIENTQAASFPFVTAQLSHYIVTKLLSEEKYLEVLDISRKAGATFVAFSEHSQSGFDIFNPARDTDSILATLPKEIQVRADSLSGTIGLIPVIFKIAYTMIEAPERGNKLLEEVSKYCRDVSKQAYDPIYWEKAAEVIELFLNKSLKITEYVNFVNTINWDTYPTVMSVAYLLSSLHNDIIPITAIQAHLAIMPTIENSYLKTMTIYRQVILPFIEKYWISMFKKSKFYFNSPTLVGSEITEALKQPDKKRVKAILKAICGGLRRVKITPEVKQWFNQ